MVPLTDARPQCILGFIVYSHQKTSVFSAAEILLQIYQNPIHFKWDPLVDEVLEAAFADRITSSANVPHLNVWGFDISAAEFPQPTKNARL